LVLDYSVISLVKHGCQGLSRNRVQRHSINVGRLCSMPRFRHFSSHASTEKKKSQKMLIYLTGLFFGMVGLSLYPYDCMRSFISKLWHNSDFTSLMALRFEPNMNCRISHAIVSVLVLDHTKICPTYKLCSLVHDLRNLQSVEEMIARRDSNQTVTSRCYFYPLDVSFLH
ncbi:uncharacterized protein, partial [Medicago truncatula]|uniref:uncharacterized protein n=1 Tax=Medicago truncatula TaxID=3880 RepID=UPI0019686DF5